VPVLLSTDADGILDVGQSWVYLATGTSELFIYNNIGTVNSTYTDDAGNVANPTDADDSGYYGYNQGLSISINSLNGTTFPNYTPTGCFNVKDESGDRSGIVIKSFNATFQNKGTAGRLNWRNVTSSNVLGLAPSRRPGGMSWDLVTPSDSASERT
jgi:hypothetical protein